MTVSLTSAHQKGPCGPRTSMMLLMWGISRSMRTSTSITSARHTFFRTSGSSSAARKNKFCKKDSLLLKPMFSCAIFFFLFPAKPSTPTLQWTNALGKASPLPTSAPKDVTAVSCTRDAKTEAGFSQHSEKLFAVSDSKCQIATLQLEKQGITSMKGSMCNMSACVLLMINWLTHAIAWDLHKGRKAFLTAISFSTWNMMVQSCCIKIATKAEQPIHKTAFCFFISKWKSFSFSSLIPSFFICFMSDLMVITIKVVQEKRGIQEHTTTINVALDLWPSWSRLLQLQGFVGRHPLPLQWGSCCHDSLYVFTWFWRCCVWRTAGISGWARSGVGSEHLCPGFPLNPHRSSATLQTHPAKYINDHETL